MRAPTRSPANANNGARENGLRLSFARIRGRGALVIAGGRAVMSIIEGEGDSVARDDDGVEGVVIVGNEDSSLDVNEGEGTMVVSGLSNGHQSNVVNGTPDIPA